MMDTSMWYVVPPQFDESRGVYMNKNLVYIGLDVDDTHVQFGLPQGLTRKLVK